MPRAGGEHPGKNVIFLDLELDHLGSDGAALSPTPSQLTALGRTAPANQTQKPQDEWKPINPALRMNVEVFGVFFTPIPFHPVKTLDFNKHEIFLKHLGLWDFIHLDYDFEIRVDLLQQLVLNFDPKVGFGTVDGMSIEIGQKAIACALKLPVQQVEIDRPSEVTDSETIEFVEDFVMNWMLLCEDAWVMPEEVLEWLGLIREGKLDEVDWAGIMWLMVKRELVQVCELGNCYYASHLQRLIKFQKPGLFEERAMVEGNGKKEQGMGYDEAIKLDDDNDDEQDVGDVKMIRLDDKDDDDDEQDVSDVKMIGLDNEDDDDGSSDDDDSYDDDDDSDSDNGKKEQCTGYDEVIKLDDDNDDEQDVGDVKIIGLDDEDDDEEDVGDMKMIGLDDGDDDGSSDDDASDDDDFDSDSDNHHEAADSDDSKQELEDQNVGLQLELGKIEADEVGALNVTNLQEYKEVEPEYWLQKGRVGSAVHFMQQCNQNEIRGMAFQSEKKAEVGEENYDISMKYGPGEGSASGNCAQYIRTKSLHSNPPIHNPDHTTEEPFASRTGTYVNVGNPFWSNNSLKRQLEHQDENDHLCRNYHNKRARKDDPSDQKLLDFDFCMEQIQIWMDKARMAYISSEVACRTAKTNEQVLLKALKQRKRMIEHLQRSKQEDIHKKEVEVYNLTRELHFMGNLVADYKSAFKRTQKLFSEYREQCQLAEEPLYRDAARTGGVVLSNSELEKQALKQEEEERIVRVSVEEKISEFQLKWFDNLEACLSKINVMGARLLGFEKEVKVLKEIFTECKTSKA